jgi:diaminohydroxyphosphoribosylaminopyrimidine deaminase/5-amino-6-(5-phosphoribosylamino)uracil reductase
VDSKLETPITSKVFENFHQSGVILVCGKLDTPEKEQSAKAFAARGMEVIPLPNTYGKVDLPKLFAYLAQEREMNEIHVEAGFKLNGSLLRENCVDELLLYYAPFLMGEGIGMANISPLTTLDQRQNWQILDQAIFEPDMRLRLAKLASQLKE